MNDPKLIIPSNAYLVGTLNKADRSRQYVAAHSPEELLKAVNQAWTKIRTNEAAIHSKDIEIADLRRKVTIYKLKNLALMSIFTGLAWEGAKALFEYFFS